MIIVNPEKRRDNKSSFGALTEYIESGDEGESKLLFSGVRGLAVKPKNTQEIIKEFTANASLNKRVKDPVFHTILSWKEGEIPTEKQVQAAIDIYLKEVGMEKCHCFYGVHKNTNNIHVHLCISRIDTETHRSIIPADGWTKKANMRAARRIEMEQGWEKDPGGMYQVIGNEIMEVVSEEKHTSINKKAKDFENFTSEKSAIRYAKDHCTDSLFNSSSWTDLHQDLAALGVRLEKKGSGCILVAGETAVKLSSVSQQLSLSKLEKRLGAFERKKADVQVEEYKPESLRKTTSSEKYREARKQFYADKKEAKEELDKELKREFSELLNQQKEDRKKLYESRESWKGKGIILNALKSRLAWEHVQKKKDLKERHIQKKVLWQKTIKTFPCFTEWLRAQGKDKEADQWRYRETLPMAVTGLGNEYNEPQKNKPHDLYATGIEYWGRGESLVFRNKQQGKRIAFVDVGRRIDIVNWRDEQAVLDALTLAQQKWGKCVVHGSEQYKKLCVNVAAKNNINLINPELQSQLKREKEQLLEEREEVKNVQPDMKKDFARYHAAVGADHYRVTAFWEDDKGQRRGWVLDKQKGGLVSRGFTPDEVQYKATLIEKLDSQGKNIYYTPISQNKHHILIDDMTKGSLQKLLNDGYKPAVIIESSPDNYQAILNIPKIANEFDKDISNKLMIELNTEYGDPKIQGAIHPHRTPGTHNAKKKHQREDGTFPEVCLLHAEAVDCRKAYAQSFEICKTFSQEKKRMQEAQRKEQEKQQQREYQEGPLLSPVDAYNAHAKNIMQHVGVSGVTNWNRIDSMIAVRMCVTGYSCADIKDAIEHGAPAVRPAEDRNKHKWHDYAERTASYPESPRGQMQIREFGEKYHAHWLRIEGRLPEKQKREKGVER